MKGKVRRYGVIRVKEVQHLFKKSSRKRKLIQSFGEINRMKENFPKFETDKNLQIKQILPSAK